MTATRDLDRDLDRDPATDPDLDADLDADLVALAAGGDPDEPLPADAVPFHDVVADDDLDLLPDWYMPAPMAGTARLGGWRRIVAWLVVASFLALAAAGLCSTYGAVVIA